ncbi:hypothetical protein ACVWZ8_002152 [Arthrobacter sp. UYCu723]
MHRLLLTVLGIGLTIVFWYLLSWGISQLGRLESWHLGLLLVLAIVPAVLICKRIAVG